MMTLETTNEILALSREGKTLREISPIVGYSIARLSCFLREHNPLIVDHIEACPNCGKQWDVKILSRGFKKQFCCKRCRLEYYNKTKFRKKARRICERRGKEFIAYTYKKTRFCCKSCAKRHQDEQRHQMLNK